MSTRFIIAAVLCLFGFFGVAHAQLPEPFAAPSLDLRTGVPGRTAIATPDGGAIVAGDFRWIGGDNERFGLVKLLPDGSVDANWNVTASGIVWRMVLLGDDLYLAGQFSNINNSPRKGLARVSLATGALSSWDPNAASSSSYVFNSIVHDGGALYISGTFTQLGATTRTNAAKLALDGTVNAAWNPSIVGGNANALVSDGAAIYLAGSFSQVNGIARQRAAKLSLDTAALDPSWAPAFNSEIVDLATDGGFLYGIGCFNQVNSVSRNFLARVSTAGVGTLDATWNPAPNGGCTNGLTVNASHVYVGGPFTALGGSAAGGIGRVSKTGTGSLDTTWQPQGDQQTYGALPLPNSNVLLWGEFVNIGGTYSAGLSRVNNIGSQVGPAIYAEQRTYIASILVLPDNSVLIGGGFTRAGTVLRRGLMKLTPAGVIDESFTTTVRGRVDVLKRDGTHVYVGGSFTQIGGTALNNFARMSDAGTVDTAWNPQVNSSVTTIALDTTTNVYIGGFFNNVLGTTRNRLASLNRSALTLNSWNPDAGNGFIRAIELLGNDVYIGGNFTTIGGLSRANLAKVSTAGVVDPTFVADTVGGVQSLLAGPGGTLYVGGSFSTISGLGRPGLARLLTSSGAPDPTWNSFLGSGFVGALSNAANGIYVAGFYQSIGGVARSNIARLSHSGIVAPLFAPAAVSNDAYSVVEQNGKVYVGGFSNYFAPTNTRQISLVAFPIDATPVNTTTTITADAPENSSPFQAYQVSVNVVGTGGIIPANQLVVIEDDLGATCSAFLDGAGNGSCEIASRQAGTRTLSARFSGTPLLLASSDTEPHTVASTSETPPVNTAFALRAPALVSASVRLSDGSVVIGGNFTRIGDTLRRGLAKLLPDGTLDPSFSADVIGSVTGLTRDASDNIFVIGAFGYIDGALKRNAAKLSASGDVISTWSTGETCVGANAEMLVDAAGDLLLSGCTRFISGTPNTFEARLLKLSGSSGALMPDFSSVLIKTNSTAIFPNISVLQDASGLYLYGRFETVNGTARSNIAKIDAAGALTSWNPGTNNNIRKLIADGTGGLYIAGDFSQVAGQARSFLAQLDATGTLVNAFTPASDSTVRNMLLANNQLYVTGFFSQIGGGTRFGTAKLDPVTGTADAGFVGAPYSAVRLERLGTQLWGASNTLVFGATEITSLGAFRQDINNGAVLPTPSVTRQAQVRALARQPDGATLVGGSFVRPGSLQANIARISAAGQLDTSFTPPLGSVNAIKVRDNGDIYVAAGSSVRKINAAGVIDASFTSALNSTPLSLQLVSDGVIVGGFFSTASTLPRVGLAKLDYATGVANASWNPTVSASGSVRTIAQDSTGNLYFGGSFNSVGGVARLNIAKTDAAGVLISSWQADANSAVSALMVDGTSIYVGGGFNILGGTNRSGIGKLSIAAGTVGATWNPAGNRFVNILALARAQDGGILVGGSFLNVGGAYRSNAAKLDPLTGIAESTWNPSFDSTVRAILAGYGGTPARVRQPEVEQNIAIGGDFEFAGSTEMPGFTAVSSVGVPAERVFCSGFEDDSCRPLP